MKKGGAWKEKVLHALDKDTDGWGLIDTPILDSTGALYGTASNGGSGGVGTVFKLTPPITKGKAWKERTLYTFTGTTDGRMPGFGTLLRIKGSLYGTTVQGGPVSNPVLGVVFKIVP